MTYEVGDTRTPTLTIDTYDTDTVVVLTITSPLGVVTTPVVTGPDGSGTWTAPQYTLNAPQRWTERWVSTNTVSGAGAGAATYTFDVDPIQPAAGPGQSTAFATVDQYSKIVGGPLPANLARLLRVASSIIRGEIGGAIWDITNANTAATLAEATCEQVTWAAANGWTNGVPVSSRAISLGSASMGAATNQAGGSGATPTLSPVARELLLDADLLGGAPESVVVWGSLW